VDSAIVTIATYPPQKHVFPHLDWQAAHIASCQPFFISSVRSRDQFLSVVFRMGTDAQAQVQKFVFWSHRARLQGLPAR